MFEDFIAHLRPIKADNSYGQCQSLNERKKHGTHCPICIGYVNKKNSWGEIARVFVQVKVWFK